MPNESPLTVRPIEPGDREAWEGLYADYAVFYGKAQSAAMRATVWSWLHDPAHELSGLLALEDGQPVGLAHFRPFARPLDASTGGFLE